jgi:hypothetical protein
MGEVMDKHKRLKPALLMVILLGITQLSLQAAEPWRAGSAKVVITPQQFIWMSGYGGRDHVAEGKLTDLWAKALVLQDSLGNRAVLVTLDLVGIDRTLTAAISKSLDEEYGFQRRQIALCTSHTHTGPVVGKNLGPLHYERIAAAEQKKIDQYVVQLHKKVVDVVGEAIKQMVPSHLTWGSGHCEVAVNRRTNSEKNVPQLRQQGLLKGPFDHDVPVLAVRDLEGELQTVVFGYACHATVLSFYQWSGDYPGFAQIALEKAHPGVEAMFFAGCGADQNPLPRRTVALATSYGNRLAAAVEETLAGTVRPVEGTLATHYREVPLPLDTLPSTAEIKANLKSKSSYEAARARWLLRDIEAGQPLQQHYPYPIATWKIGDTVDFVILGGEVVIDYALRIKELDTKSTTHTNLWVAGYSNDVMAYIPSRRVLREGGYEGGSSMVYYGLPAHWAPELEALIIDAVKKQLQD